MTDTLPKDEQPKKKPRKPDPLWDAMVEIWPQYKTSQKRGEGNKMHQAFRQLGVEPYELAVAVKKYQKKCKDYLAEDGNLPSAGALINQWQNCKPGMSECLRFMFDEWMKGKPIWLKDMECAYYVFLYIKGKADQIPEKLLGMARNQWTMHVASNGDKAILHAVDELKVTTKPTKRLKGE